MRVPDKIIRMQRSEPGAPHRPVMLAICGDSAAGKTTITKGLVDALGPDRCLSICVDDYHRYDRAERRALPFTPLHPDCNFIDVMEQHLQLLALGRPVLKPVYDHATGTITRPEYVAPKDFVIVEGLHPLSTRLTRACFDVTVYLDPPEATRRAWKMRRDTTKRGYTPEQVRADLARREPESARYIRPQRRFADIVVRFSPGSAELLLRPTVAHPPLNTLLPADDRSAMALTVLRDEDGTPTECLRIKEHSSTEDGRQLEKAIWQQLDVDGGPPDRLGEIAPGERSESLALTQLILLYHLLQNRDA